MPRLRNATTGVVVNVDDGTAATLGAGWRPAETATGDYAGMKVAELRAEIERRNTGRDEADLLPSDGKKADLMAALELDDQD